MPSKKRKYNARFPAGRIKKIMQTDEEVGKVAQAVPIIIFSAMFFYNNLITEADEPRTLELFVESLLKKALEVTTTRNAKTLSPSHVKQCILAESRFDFLRDLVQNIPDVSAAEEKEIISAENSPNSSRFSDLSIPPRRIGREDSNSSSSSDIKVQQMIPPFRPAPIDHEINRIRPEMATSTITSEAVDLTKKTEEKPRTAFFYQETLNTDDVAQHRSVIKLNPTYNSPQPSTSALDVPKSEKKPFFIDVRQNNTPLASPRTPITPILNIDFTKSLAKPEIKLLDSTAATMVAVRNDKPKGFQRQNSKLQRTETKRVEPKTPTQPPINIDLINSGNLQIDEDYDT